MKKFVSFEDIAVCLDRANIDTDAIIPKQFLRKIDRSGFGKHLFHNWRFLDDAGKVENPDFILNKEKYRKAAILIAKDNFGCGSSREHAPWSLEDYGFRVIIAPSFADIFYNNCFKNGMLPIILTSKEVEHLFEYVLQTNEPKIKINLEEQQVAFSDSVFSFEVDSFRKHCLLNGLDDIGLTLKKEDSITRFEQKQQNTFPWLYQN